MSVDRRLENLRFQDLVLLMAILGGRSYQWSTVLSQHMAGLTLENYEATLIKIVEAEARGLAAYVREVCRAWEEGQ